LSFPTRSAIAKLAQVHGLSKREGFALKSSTVLKVHPVAVTCERLKSPKPPFGGRKSGTPKNPKARKEDPEDPKRSRNPSGPQSLEEMQRLREEFLLLRKGSFPSSSGERVSLPLPPPWGGSSGTSKPGVSSKRKRNRGGFLPQKAHGGIKDPMPRESPISNSPPEISSCGGPIPPSMLKPWNLPRVFLEELRKVPLSRSNQGVLEGVHATGSLRVLAGIRHQALRPSSKVSHIPG
jgi:hypothetical protein